MYQQPAFPIPRVKDNNDEVIQWEDSGMSLRDYFAAQAIAGCEARAINSRDVAMEVAKSAYLIADAMIEIGNREPNT